MKRNVVLLSLSQAVLTTGTSMMLTSSAIVAMGLAQNQSLVTLPLALLFLAQMATTIPASFFMAKVGRRFGFMTSAIIGLGGGAIATAGIIHSNFIIFCVGTALIGSIFVILNFRAFVIFIYVLDHCPVS